MEVQMKVITTVWLVSMFVLLLVAVLLLGNRILGIGLSDTLVRILGVTAILAIPIFVFSTIRRAKK